METNSTDNWPFDQPRNCATITMRQVLEGSEPILLVFHDADDHAWQFFGTSVASIKESRLVALEEIVTLDPTVLEIADLPPGWRADREKVGGQWRRREHSGEPEGDNNSGCLLPFVMIVSAILFFVSIGIVVVGMALSSGISSSSGSIFDWLGIPAFCGYFGLIFLSCFKFAKGKRLRMFGWVITTLDISWCVLLIGMCLSHRPDNPILFGLMIASFPFMNFLWYKAVRSKLRNPN